MTAPAPPFVRAAGHGDLSAVVKVHQAAFRGFFLDRMGPAFLRGYYAAILSYPQGIFLVSENAEGDICGFAVGFCDPAAFYAHFRARRLRLAPVILLALLRSPSLLIEILRNTRRVQGTAHSSGTLVELSSIGVSKRQSGMGSALLRAFVAQSASRGASEVTLTTDRDHNDAVINFYVSHGFERQGIEMRGKRVLQVMRRKLGRGEVS